MNLKLRGKKVLVTGASQGIGLAIAQAFHAQGCYVISNARDKKKLESSIIGKERWHFVAGDVTDPSQANNVVEKALHYLDQIDILICNVGSGRSAPPGKESLDDWQESLSVNLFSTTNMVTAATPTLKKTKGVIVCVSSICGIEVVRGAPVTYSSAKAALNAYIRGISIPLAENGIRINGVAPGNILFDGSVWERKIRENADEVNKTLRDNVPLNRLGSVDDVKNLALWLSSPLSSFSTGSIHVCDGGQTRS